MSHATSPSTHRRDGVSRGCEEWGVPRSTFYAQRDRQAAPSPLAVKRGPKAASTDEDLTEHILRVIASSPFLGEGHRKV